MNTTTLLQGIRSPQRRLSFLGKFASIIFATLFFTNTVHADIPDRNQLGLIGMYKVERSSDPIFPMASRSTEWFLDFNEGTSQGRLSGRVAISLRENVNVKVKILSWQYYPRQNKLVIGTPSTDGSGRAVARGIWELSGDSHRVALLRENVGLVMKPADPADY